MDHVLILTHAEATFKVLADRFAAKSACLLSWSPSLSAAVTQIKAAPPHLVVIDEVLDGITGIEAARALVMVDAMVNIAVVSRLAPEAFHRAGEGLGLLAQLAPNPSAHQIENVLNALQDVSELKI